MSEVKTYNGPLDISRRIYSEMREIDSIADDYVGGDPTRAQELIGEINSIDKANPLIRQKVDIYGSVLTSCVDDSLQLFPIALPPLTRSPQPPASGIYNGYSLKAVFDTDAQRRVHRVVHMVVSEDPPIRSFDENEDIREVTKCSYVSLEDSVVIPRIPYNNHSLEDLEGDRIVRKLDEIIFRETQNRLDIIRDLGTFTNKLLVQDQASSVMSLQRLSYVNGVGLLDNLIIIAEDIVVKGNASRGTQTTISDLSVKIEILPTMFGLNKGYQRSTIKPDEATFLAHDELYVNGSLEDGRAVVVPAKSILDTKEG